MPELSTDERRYLQTACAASPQYGFRARIVGQRVSFTDVQTDEIVAALARAGMVEASGDCDVQLTRVGREHARELAAPPTPKRRSNRPLLIWLAVGGGIALTTLSLLMWAVTGP